jgi:hypothetical protein
MTDKTVDRRKRSLQLFLLIAFMNLTLPSLAFNQLSKKKETTNTKKLFKKFVGFWLGEGKAGGKSVRDELEWKWALDNRFLYMHLRSIKGDTLRADGYLWYNEAQDRVEFYEFNNGAWPVRLMIGHIIRNKIVLEEKTEDRHIQISLEFETDSLLKLTEANMKSGVLEPFVEETFKRKASR